MNHTYKNHTLKKKAKLLLHKQTSAIYDGKKYLRLPSEFSLATLQKQQDGSEAVVLRLCVCVKSVVNVQVIS